MKTKNTSASKGKTRVSENVKNKESAPKIAALEPVQKMQSRTPGNRGCGNRECRLRSTGCMGFEGCPGYTSAAK